MIDVTNLLLLYALLLAVVICLIVPYKVVPLGECFGICSFVFGSKKICQTRKPINGESCQERLKLFAKQNNTLAAQLPPGTYSIVTHKVILKRIQDKDDIAVLSIKSSGKRSLKANLRSICDCHRCKERYTCNRLTNKKVEFYKLKIRKT